MVDGATGYLGSHLVFRLVNEGRRVRCLVHQRAQAKDVEFLKSLGAEVFQGDLERGDDAVSRCFSGAAAAVHLIGSIAPRKGESLRDLHVKQSEAFVEQALKGAVKNVVMVTALGTRSDAPSQYHSTKWMAEEKVRQSGLNFVILRPSLLIGREAGSRDSKLVKRLTEVIRTCKLVPLVNGGTNKLQPLFIGDMTLAVSKALDALLESDDKEIVGQTLELGGAEVIEMRDLAKMIMQKENVQRPIVSLPQPLASGIALALETISQVPLLTRDQVKLSMSDNICKNNDLTEKFGMSPRSIKYALDSYDAHLAEAAVG